MSEIAAILGEAHDLVERRSRNEWVDRAKSALQAVSGLCSNQAANDEALECVNRKDMAVLLNLISEQLEQAQYSGA
ncbi:hypothetical protein [Pandoraea anapnoica]|uniref:hypothetical protein n=1 Tax=Pandoraea anapnoica TaxID=2508301 RepID=UPI0012411096|nr:hypothetical protein [Pandoraea anapnoica]